ncbi:hypothetical protein JCM19236_3636 [Vibrio sp. JCM 19236]|nr:hypothetical protein JCM19236_3636 [Vibrio sp. JCM 19236]
MAGLAELENGYEIEREGVMCIPYSSPSKVVACSLPKIM